MRCFLILLFIMIMELLYAQKDRVIEKDDYLNMSLSELLNIKVSANPEEKNNLFSSNNYYELRENEIQKFFVKSIPEALRLVPGVLVMETTAGNYFVGINTMENSSLFSYDLESSNVILMIDGFIQNESLDGDIAWEKLNISIDDVYKIEVFYGAGAGNFEETSISGVINITTKSAVDAHQGFSFNSTYSSNNDSRIGGYFKGRKDALRFNISYDVEQRNRYNKDYYFIQNGQNGYTNDLSVLNTGNFIKDYNAVFPKENISKQRQSLKIDLCYKIASKYHLNYSFGYVNSLAVKNRILIGISDLALSTWTSEYFRNTITLSNKKLKIQVSNKTGVNDMFVGLQGFSNRYDENTTTVNGEYIFQLFPKMYIRPNFSFKEIIIGDSKYLDESIGLFNRQTEIGVFYGGVDFKWIILNKITTLSSVKWSKLRFPGQEYYPSYSMEINYDVNKSHRVLLSYNNVYKRNSVLTNQINFPMGKYFMYSYNRDLAPYQTQAYNLAYKATLREDGSFGLGLFVSKSKNYNMPVMSFSKQRMSYDNLDMKSYQYGITSDFSCNLFKDKLMLRAYFTFTYSYWKDFYSSYLADEKRELKDMVFPAITPSYYGGITVFAKPFKRILMNLKAYFFDGYNYYSALERVYNNEEDIIRQSQNYQPPSIISSSLIIDTGIKIQINKAISASFTVNNLLANTRQVYAGDKIKPVYFFGMNFNY